jgi:hypothetical protein
MPNVSYKYSIIITITPYLSITKIKTGFSGLKAASHSLISDFTPEIRIPENQALIFW